MPAWPVRRTDKDRRSSKRDGGDGDIDLEQTDPRYARLARPQDAAAGQQPRATGATILTDRERQEQKRETRIAQVKADHWLHFTCPRGPHVFELHRGSEDATHGGDVICPMHRVAAVREQPEQTVTREQREQMSPAALVSRAVDALTEWATDRLHASRWTELSEDRRAAQQRASLGEPISPTLTKVR